MAIIEVEHEEAVEEQEPEHVRVRGLPFFPHFLLREVVVMCLIAGSLILLASIYPAGLLQPADPFTTPTPIYPEWYFLYVFGFLKFWTYDIGPIPAKVIGVTVPMVLWYGLLILVPFIDRNPSTDIRNRKIAVALGVIALIAVLAFTYYGIVHGE
ncbi:MAG: hypothetical protein OIN66_18395 [Candidatus Methanoperedens sp.]|nr:hypothetical protein [Candidatus Methanoperedens sp.]